MDPLTPKEIGQWQQLEKVRLEKTKRRDDNKNEKKNIREQLDAHSLARKNDPTSVHNKLDDYFIMK